jgi:hypothetical protein
MTMTRKEPKKAKADPYAIELHEYVRQRTGTIEGILELLEGVSPEGWDFLNEHHPDLLPNLKSVASRLATLCEQEVGIPQ